MNLTVGQKFTILQRRFDAHGGTLPQDSNDGTLSPILRAYPRPRGQEMISVETTIDGVTVTALAPGYGLVDVIDEASEPRGTDYEFYVIPATAERERQTITAADVGEMPKEILA